MRVIHRRMIALSGHKSFLALIDITVRTLHDLTSSYPHHPSSVRSVRVGTQLWTRGADPSYSMGGVGLQQLYLHVCPWRGYYSGPNDRDALPFGTL